jgi:hypothetical protein
MNSNGAYVPSHSHSYRWEVIVELSLGSDQTAWRLSSYWLLHLGTPYFLASYLALWPWQSCSPSFCHPLKKKYINWDWTGSSLDAYEAFDCSVFASVAEIGCAWYFWGHIIRIYASIHLCDRHLLIVLPVLLSLTSLSLDWQCFFTVLYPFNTGQARSLNATL